MRDYAIGTTFDTKFTTRRFSTGAPFTLAGTPTVAAYPDNSLTEITAGITLTVDFDGRTGLHNIRVVATVGNGYAAGSNYALVITAGTVDSVSVVGEVVGEFSLEAQSPLRPTTGGRTLDVSAGGEAGVDWANVGSQTTAVTLSGTTVNDVTTKTGYGIGVGGIAATAFAAGAIDAAAVAANAIGASELATDAVNEIRDAIFDRVFSAAYSSHTFDELVKLMAAALAGKCSGMATATGTFRNLADTGDVIVATQDANGNRSAVTRTP